MMSSLKKRLERRAAEIGVSTDILIWCSVQQAVKDRTRRGPNAVAFEVMKDPSIAEQLRRAIEDVNRDRNLRG
jgi:hypothetical protein